MKNNWFKLGRGVFFLGFLSGCWCISALADDSLVGPAFSDPRQLASMPKEWVKRSIEYDPSVKKAKADISITLDQQIFLMLGKQIAEYGKKQGIHIVNREGTCGISDGLMAKKQADLAGYCCAPDKSARLPGLKFYTLGIASKVFITHPDNPVQNITMEQLRKIYQGEYSLWSDIKDLAAAPPIPLHVVGRLHCKARPGHWRLLLDNEDMFGSSMKSVSGIPDVIHEVLANPGAIGYETFTNIGHYVKGKYPRVLKVEGQDPHDLSAIAELRYPIYRTFELAIWEDKALRNRHADALVSFLLKAVETLGPQHGFVPVAMLKKAGWLFVGEEVVGEPGQTLQDIARTHGKGAGVVDHSQH